MRHVSPVRQKLGVPTIFNLLGPLTNPAGAEYQLLGVGKPHLRPQLASALALLGAHRAVVVCGEDGLDEVTLAGATFVSETIPGETREALWRPEDFGLEQQSLEATRVEGPEESAAMIRDILHGKPGPARDIVILNAAAALWTAKAESNFQSAAHRAAAAIDTGAAKELLVKLGKKSSG
jgi:anthranilate phosphoribosyltransferase